MKKTAKNKRKQKFFIFGLTFLLFITGSQEPINAQITLTPEQMVEELEYVADLIRRVHPYPFHAGSEAEFNSLVAELTQEVTSPMSREDFFFILNRLTHYVKDAHTYIYIPISEEQFYLPASFYWAVDGLVVTDSTEDCGLEFGDRIISIGNVEPLDLLEELSNIIPAENSYYLRSRGANRLSYGSFLKHLGLVEDNIVDFVVEDKQGNTQSLSVELIPVTPLSAPPPDPLLTDQPLNNEWYGWNFYQDHSLAYFYLDRCIYSSEYRNALINFFEEVNELGIEKIAVDLRRNPGGSSRVVNEFLIYLPVRAGGWFHYLIPSKVKNYTGDVRYSPEAAEQRGYSQISGYYKTDQIRRRLGVYMNISLPHSLDHIFYGKVYILTSNYTFSSGNWFGVIFQDNGLGTLVGEPTGNIPTHFGDILHFETPYSNFYMIISHKMFYRPDYQKDSEDTLYPDIYIPTTVDDIREGRDPQLEGLFSLFSSEKMKKFNNIERNRRKNP